jgi:antitoxin PrlF
MKMFRSKITSKGRTTIPRQVRDALHLRAGDTLVYRIGKESVTLTSAGSAREDMFGTFSEWSSGRDCAAYREL